MLTSSAASSAEPAPKPPAWRKSSATKPNILTHPLHLTPSSSSTSPPSTSALAVNTKNPFSLTQTCPHNIEVTPPSPATSSPASARHFLNPTLAAKTPNTIRQQQQSQQQIRRSKQKPLTSRQRSSSSSALPATASTANSSKQHTPVPGLLPPVPHPVFHDWTYFTPITPSGADSLTAPSSPVSRSAHLRSLSSPHLADPYTTSTTVSSSVSGFPSTPGSPSVAPFTAPPSPLLSPSSYASPLGSPYIRRRPSFSQQARTHSQSFVYPVPLPQFGYPFYTSPSMDRLQAFYPQNGACVGDMNRDGESDDDAILMAKPRKKSSQNLRANHDMNGSVYALRARTRNDSLPTAAFGEVTETEDERQPRSLPTARVPSTTTREQFRERHPILDRLTDPLLFLFRILSIFPALIGLVYNIYHVIDPRHHDHSYPNNENTRLDYVVCILWSLLTAHQAYALAAGLYLRWKAYYDIPATLVRLLALQSICWPATHFTFHFLDISRRPLVGWALVGTTTCVSRAIQIWATSNLSVGPPGVAGGAGGGSGTGTATGASGNGNGSGFRGHGLLSLLAGVAVEMNVGAGKGKRKWDWWEIGWKCVAPAAVLHFIMAWALLLRIELGANRAASLDPLM